MSCRMEQDKVTKTESPGTQKKKKKMAEKFFEERMEK